MPIDVPIRFETERMLWSVEQVYSPSECADVVTTVRGSASSPTWITGTAQTTARSHSTTVLVYFNDDFKGGETVFQEQFDQTVVPKTGMAAVFQHKLRHEGRPVLHGTKYAMRSDVIYEADEAIGRVG